MVVVEIVVKVAPVDICINIPFIGIIHLPGGDRVRVTSDQDVSCSPVLIGVLAELTDMCF